MNNLFNPRDATKILSIPLNSRVQKDKVIWHFNPNGNYTVWSGYKIINEVVAPNDELKVNGDWSNLWKLKVLAKVKAFLWRVVRDCIPNKLICKRKVLLVHCLVFFVEVKWRKLGISLSLALL